MNVRDTVRVTITERDFVRLNLWLALHHRSTLVTWFVYVVLVGIALAYFNGMPRNSWDWELLAICAIVGGTVGFALFVGGSLWAGVARARNSKGVLGDHEYSFQDDGLFERTAANETLVKWGGVKRVHQTPECLFIEVTPGMFHLLPRRSFQSGESFEQFWLQAQRLSSKA